MKKIALLIGIMLVNFQVIAAQETLVLGAGCFWGVEKRFEKMPGVIDVVSGYAGGTVAPTYKSITGIWNKFSDKNHAEVVKITFDNSKISLHTLLKKFWEMHDPTTANRQGNDVGTNYRSVILTQNKEQKKLALMTRNEFEALLKQANYKRKKIVTQIKDLDKFYPAESYHQDYIARNPNGYCPDHSTGVVFNKNISEKRNVSNNKSVSDKVQPLGGKEILLIDAEFDCPYCARFKKDVVSKYKGSIPLRTVYARQLSGFNLSITDFSKTPTILFIQDGKDLFAHYGYMSPKKFYQALGKLSLAKKAFEIAFEKGTEARYCQDHEILREKRDGWFVDILSGAKLFDSRDKFDSNTGWPSWTKSVAGSVTEQADYSFGMVRTEIISASSGIHLGHKFNDGPNGMPRYCINGSVLKFIPRSKN